MNALKITIGLILIMLAHGLVAQPYSLDETIKPIKLELKEDPEREGATAAAANGTITDFPHHFFVTNCNMFQFIDLYIFSNFGNPDFKVDLVRNTWGDVEQSKNTASSEDGIINFKLRAEGDFGFKIFPGSEEINYTVVAYASPPVQEYLGSAFKKVDMDDIDELNGGSSQNEKNGGGGNSDSNTILYILLGVALLVIGFLAAKVLSKNKASILIVLAIGISTQLMAQEEVIVLDPDVEEVDIGDIRTAKYAERLRDIFEGAGKDIDDGLGRLGKVGERIKEELEHSEDYKKIRELYDSYIALGACIHSTPPPSMPRVPSFCESNEDCASCFVTARDELNTNRYSFERLRTIYNCTKTFTDRALAFGDNVSGVHGVSGLAWQSERRKIEKSVKNLQKAYDAKYIELLEKQKAALMKINECEAKYGIQDWYERFGYMYYEFSAMNYKRNK